MRKIFISLICFVVFVFGARFRNTEQFGYDILKLLEYVKKQKNLETSF